MKKLILCKTNLLLLLFSVLMSTGTFAAASEKPTSDDLVVQGVVTDKEGNPLVGVTVTVKADQMTGTVTDINGNYKITVPDEDAVLVFSYIGFISEEVPVNGRSVIDFTMTEDVTQLGEIVVIGYGTQEKRDLTGSVVSADLKSFEEAPNTNILQALSGSVSGVDIGQVTAAGAEPSITVRGRSTLNGNQQPLVVLDGVVYRGRLTDLNPKDIQSIDILKDPSSKAIYGAQAANGVLLVSTKMGKRAQQPEVSYSGYYATQTPSNELTPQNRQQYLKSARDVDWENGYIAPDFTQPNPDWNPESNIPFFPPLLEGFQNGTDFNWYDEVTSPGYITDHHLSVRGGSERTSYLISGGLTRQSGWMLNDEYDRKTARVNIETDINDWLTIGGRTFGSFSDLSGESPTLSTISSMSPLATPRDEEGELIVNPLGNLALNPFLQSASDDKDLRNNLYGLFYASIDIPWIEGLNYRANFSNNYRWNFRGNSNIYGAGLSGSAFKETSSIYDVTFDNIVSYDRRFGNDDHGLKFTFVAGLNEIQFESTLTEGSDFANLDLSYNSLEQAVIQEISSEAWEESYLYQMARISYDYKRKYLLTATLRRDGYSGFASGNNIALFPSVGVGWVLSEENFLDGALAINFLKLRASYGRNGNLTGRYSSLARITTPESSRYLFGDGGTPVNGQIVTSLANPGLTWEKTDGINVGIDFGFFEDKVYGSIDYYHSTTNDLLWDFVLPQITGFNSITSNLGEITNHGFELELTTTPVNTNRFKWEVGANFFTNRNEIRELLGQDNDGDGREDDLIANGLFIGESIGSVYQYVIDGLWQISDGEEIPAGWAPGTHKLVDLDNDGEFTPEGDRQIIGRTEPAYSFGIRNAVSYKNFQLRFFIKSIQGGRDGYLGINNPWSGPYETPGNAQNNNWYAEVDYWSPDNPGATFRRPGLEAPIPSRRFFDRSFVRLQDISLSYSFDEKMAEKIGVQKLKLFVSGKNLLTLTDWEGWDPETGQGLGPTDASLPVMRGFAFGLDITL